MSSITITSATISIKPSLKLAVAEPAQSEAKGLPTPPQLIKPPRFISRAGCLMIDAPLPKTQVKVLRMARGVPPGRITHIFLNRLFARQPQVFSRLGMAFDNSTPELRYAYWQFLGAVVSQALYDDGGRTKLFAKFDRSRDGERHKGFVTGEWLCKSFPKKSGSRVAFADLKVSADGQEATLIINFALGDEPLPGAKRLRLTARNLTQHNIKNETE